MTNFTPIRDHEVISTITHYTSICSNQNWEVTDFQVNGHLWHNIPEYLVSGIPIRAWKSSAVFWAPLEFFVFSTGISG